MEPRVIEQLKPWIEQRLAGVGDMDPKDMAEFTIALLDTPGGRAEQKAACERDLEEFLHNATGEFVGSLMGQLDALENPTAAAAPQTAQAPAAASEFVPRPAQSAFGGQQEFRANFRGRNPASGAAPQVGAPAQSAFGSFGAPGGPNGPSNGPSNGLGDSNGPGADANFQMPPMPFDMNIMQKMAEQGFPMPNFPGGPGGMGFPGFPGGSGGPGGSWNRRGRGGNRQQRGGNRQSSLGSVHNELSVANRRLVVEQLPEDKLDEEALRGYFSQFGTLTRVRVDRERKLAELEFQSHDEAVKAHGSPAPIFDNRFIKVYWRKHDDNDPQELDLEAARRVQALKQQQFEEREQKRKEHQEKMSQLIAKRQQLLQEQEQLLLAGGAGSAELTEKEKLTEVLRQQVEALKQEAESLGLADGGRGPAARGGYRGGRGGYRGRGSTPYSARGRGRGTFRGRGGFARPIGSLDLRPKTVLVRGVPPEKDEALRTELVSANALVERQGGDVVVDFADRRTAEQFFNNGPVIPEVGAVSMEWVRRDKDNDMEMN